MCTRSTGSRPCAVGRLDRETGGVDGGADALGPLRHLGRNRQAVTVVERLARMVLPVRVRREREHHVAVARAAADREYRRRRYPRPRARCGELSGTSTCCSLSRSSTRSGRGSTTTRFGPRRRGAPTCCGIATSSPTERCARSSARASGSIRVRSDLASLRARCGDPAHGKPELAGVARALVQPVSFGVVRDDRGGRGRACRRRHRDRATPLATRRVGGEGARPPRSTPSGSTPSRRSACARSSRAGPRRRPTSRRSAPASRARSARCRAIRRDGPYAYPVAARHRREHRGRRRRRRRDRARGSRPRSRTGPASAIPVAGRSTSSGAPRSAACSRPACSVCATRSSRAKDEEIAIVRDDAGGPPPDEPIELQLDPEHPEESVVRVRPWLRDPPAT